MPLDASAETAGAVAKGNAGLVTDADGCEPPDGAILDLIVMTDGGAAGGTADFAAETDGCTGALTVGMVAE